MRRSIKGMLVLLLTLTLLAAMPAFAEQGNTLLFDGKLEQWGMDSFQQVAAIGDTLYIARSSGLYARRMADGEPRQLMDFSKTDITGAPLPEAGSGPAVGWLFAGGDKLYSLDLHGGTLMRFDQDAAAFVKEASFDPATDDEDQQYLYSGLCMEGDTLYYIAIDATVASRSLMRLDIASGKKELVRNRIQLVVPYAPGVLLVGIDTMSSMGALALLNVKTGTLEEKLQLTGDFRGLQYDPAADTIYLTRKGEIYASHAFQKPETVSRMPILSPVSDGALLAGGHLAFPYADGVRIYSTDPANLAAQPLKIAGQTWELPMEDFSAANPNVTFSFMDVYPESTMDLVMHMMGEDSAADVYSLYLRNYNLDSLYRKGYFASLEDSGIIKSTVSAMYPFIKDELMRDGKIVALPFYTDNRVYAYNPKAFEAVGLTEKDVPKTYGELLDFFIRWGEEYAEQYPSIGLFEMNAEPKLYKRLVAQSIVEEWMYACRRKGEPVTCDTPEMKALLEKLVAIDFSVINALAPESTSKDYETLDDWPKQLFGMWHGASTGATYSDFFSYMPLGLSEEEPPVVLAEVQALLINPYTRNYDTALKFVEFMADNLFDIHRFDLMPGENDPVRDPSFHTDAQWFEKAISEAEEALKNAKAEDKRNIQDRLDSLQQELDQRKRFEWLISEKSIATFRALDPYFMLQKPDPIFGMNANKELVDLFYNRFQDGQLSVVQFLKELDQKLKMIELED